MSEKSINPNNVFGNTQNYKFNDLPRFVLVVAKDKIDEYYDEIEQEMLAKAQEWSIPVPYVTYSDNTQEIDFRELENLICDYKMLLERADEIDLYWDITTYCPKSLRWAISSREDELLESYRPFSQDYYR